MGTSLSDKLYQVLKDNANEKGLPLIEGKLFDALTEEYGREKFREVLADYIEKERPEFPLKPISHEDMRNTFIRLLEYDVWKFIYPHENLEQEVVEKYDDYKYPYSEWGHGMVNAPSTFNDASDYFMQHLRLACDSYGHRAPLNAFKESNAQQLKSPLGAIWRGVNDIKKEISTDVDGKEIVKLVGGSLKEDTYRMAFRLGAYIATQFKPVVAKCFYEMTEAKTVLDTSCGWGDRLCGFFATKGTELYVGCDPNPNTFEVYKKQCVEYEKILTGYAPKITETKDKFMSVGSKRVIIYRSGAEDIPYEEFPPIDCAFTSPPYFSTETYNKGGEHEEDQSWSKFSEYESWRDDFFLPVSRKSFEVLSENGHLLINIMNPKIKGKMFPSCDEVVDLLKPHFKGQIGMRIMQRPQSSESFLEKWSDVKGDSDDNQVSDKEGIDRTAMQDFMKKLYMENVWWFSKEDKDLFLPNRRNTLESFFG